ncbi:MAG: cell wall hydrolase [Pseudomonadota bacterium]
MLENPLVYAALVPTVDAPAIQMDRAERAIEETLKPKPKGDGKWGDGSDPSWKRGERLGLSSRESKCLAEGIYFEARGESYRGQLAVAQVIINRMKSNHWPNTVCGVVYQNQRWRNRCQFSFDCDGKKERITEPKAWQVAKDITEKFSDGFTLAGIDRATHYHATYVRPRWARYFTKIEKIGVHIFYRSRNGGWY